MAVSREKKFREELRALSESQSKSESEQKEILKSSREARLKLVTQNQMLKDNFVEMQNGMKKIAGERDTALHNIGLLRDEIFESHRKSEKKVTSLLATLAEVRRELSAKKALEEAFRKLLIDAICDKHLIANPGKVSSFDTEKLFGIVLASIPDPSNNNEQIVCKNLDQVWIMEDGKNQQLAIGVDQVGQTVFAEQVADDEIKNEEVQENSDNSVQYLCNLNYNSLTFRLTFDL